MEAHTLRLLPTPLAVCQLAAGAAPAVSEFGGELVALVRAEDQLTLVCPEAEAPAGAKVERGWRTLKVEAQFALAGALGVVAALSGVIAAAGISVFVLSTWDTDYLLIQADRVKAATAALKTAGHELITEQR